MRIIAGKFRSRRIHTVETRDVRPTTDRVRQAVFDTLAARLEFDDIVVLDLFAGSGLLGFESLSRGAARITFVEQNSQVISMLNNSINTLDVAAQARVLRQDALRFLQTCSDVFDLIFADPPYRFSDYDVLLDAIFSRGLLAENGYFVLEHHASIDFSAHQAFSLRKEFGSSAVSFFQTNLEQQNDNET
ncbi:16S rRNA (guanine(966)-N(2))-methyltransferase RsmD [Rhodoflexus sp.]